MRYLLLAAASIFLLPPGHGAEPARSAKPPADPWVGEFRRFNRDHTATDKEAERITVTKQPDGSYRLSGWYKAYKFTEDGKGALSDAKGGIGRLVRGEMKFGNETTRVIRAEFCYESFLLLDPWNEFGANR